MAQHRQTQANEGIRMIYGSDLGVVAAVAALAVLLLLGPLVRALGRGAGGLARVAAAGARLLAERTTRRAALGLLGSGAVLAGAAPAAAAPVAAASGVPDAAPAPAAASAAEAPPTAPGPRAPQPEARAAQRTPATYVVAAGDCLWDIARRHLPAGASDTQVAAAWPRWWAANRAAIGADPDLIHPGTRLVVPPRFRSTGTSTTAATAASSLDPDRR
jgi:nucleoid-associated protein YgaU